MLKLISSILFLSLINTLSFSQTKDIYDIDCVSFGNKEFNGESFQTVRLKSKCNRIKVKTFFNEQSYNKWKPQHNVIVNFTAGYTSSFGATAQMIGITIDSGLVISRQLIRGRLDALVAVYPNGALDVVNRADRNLTFTGSGQEKNFDMSSDFGVEKFLMWAKQEKLSVFQTHLLAYNNEVILGSNSSDVERERRFLVIATNKKGEKEHFIINKRQPASLLNATNAVIDYLKNKKYFVHSITNYDAGAEDYFRFYLNDGSVSNKLKGLSDHFPRPALMVYYYE